jgi:hypothetical protein
MPFNISIAFDIRCPILKLDDGHRVKGLGTARITGSQKMSTERF